MEQRGEWEAYHTAHCATTSMQSVRLTEERWWVMSWRGPRWMGWWVRETICCNNKTPSWYTHPKRVQVYNSWRMVCKCVQWTRDTALKLSTLSPRQPEQHSHLTRRVRPRSLTYQKCQNCRRCLWDQGRPWCLCFGEFLPSHRLSCLRRSQSAPHYGTGYRRPVKMAKSIDYCDSTNSTHNFGQVQCTSLRNTIFFARNMYLALEIWV